MIDSTFCDVCVSPRRQADQHKPRIPQHRRRWKVHCQSFPPQTHPTTPRRYRHRVKFAALPFCP